MKNHVYLHSYTQIRDGGGEGTINVPPLVSIGLSHFVVDKINWNLYPGLIALLGEVHTIMSRV